jgi:hypothetical protein
MAGRSHRQRPIIALFATTRMNAGLPKNAYCEVRDHLLPYFWSIDAPFRISKSALAVLLFEELTYKGRRRG